MITQNSKVIFETFNDGICSFCEIDDEGNAGRMIAALRFQERTVGVKRYYEAMTNKVQVDRLIRVPLQPWMSTEYLAVIEGEVYQIEQTQTITDTRPKTNDVSLHRTRKRRAADGSV